MPSSWDNFSGAFSSWRQQQGKRSSSRRIPWRWIVGVILLVAVLALRFLPAVPPVAETIQRVTLTTTLTVDIDSVPKVQESYAFVADTGKDVPLIGLPRVLPKVDGVSYGDISAAMNGVPLDAHVESFKSFSLIRADDSGAKVERSDNRYDLSYTLNGFVTSDGFERSLHFPLTSPHLLVPLDSVEVAVTFLFDPSAGIAGLPIVRFSIMDDAGASVQDVPAEKHGSNLYSVKLSNPLKPGISFVLDATWRPPAAPKDENHA